MRLPSSFLPEEDQGNMLVNISCRRALRSRTQAVIEQVEAYIPAARSEEHGRRDGLQLLGQGQNAALAFVTLEDWDERKGAEHSAKPSPPRVRALSGRRDAFIFPLSPPPSRLGTASGFTFRLQDRGGTGHGRWSLRATSCSAWPRRARSSRASARRSGRCAAAAGRHRS